MGDARIKVAKDKAALVKALRATDDATGPFQSYADVLVFAASLGLQRQSRKPVLEYSKEIDPIRQDIFYGKGYNQVINLIAIADTSDPKIVAGDDAMELERIKIFEEYVNSGLELLISMLNGSTNYTEMLLLELGNMSQGETDSETEFNLSNFLI